MLLAIAGVTGCGKSFFKDKLVEELDFEKIKIITTREMRKGEKNNSDKVFVSPEEFEKMKQDGRIFYDFELLGIRYGYTKEELFSDKNTVFEMHYETIYDFKKICPHIRTIYIFPTDIELAKEKTRERNLKPEVEEQRLLEIDEHYNRITTDESLKNQFDYVIYNNYDKKSEEDLINLVKGLINEKVEA